MVWAEGRCLTTGATQAALISLFWCIRPHDTLVPSLLRGPRRSTQKGWPWKGYQHPPKKGWCKDEREMWGFMLIMYRPYKQWLTGSIWKDFSRDNFYRCPFNVVISIEKKETQRDKMLCSLGNCTGVFQDRVRGVLSGLSLALRPWTLRQEKKNKIAVILHKEVPPKGSGSWGVLSTLQQTYLSQLGSFFSGPSLAPYFPYDEVWFPWQTFQDPPPSGP